MLRLTLLTLILLALLLPFELERTWLDLGPVVLTNVELVLWLALGLAFVCWWLADRPRLKLPRSWLVAGLLFVGAMFLSALLAPEFRGNALKATLRTSSGIALALAVAFTARQVEASRKVAVRLAVALVAGALVAAALGLTEIANASELEWLNVLRIAPTVAGPFLRLSGPFDYANQAAMYFEATLPLLLALVWLAWQGERRVLALLGVVVAVTIVEATIYTFSRASFVTMVLVLATVALLLWRRDSGYLQLRQHFHPLPALFGGSALLVITLIAINMFLNPVFRLRFQSESDNEWYRTHFEVPAELVLTAGEESEVAVTVTNEGPFHWQSTGTTPINLAARWVQPASGRELAQRPRWALTEAVGPGESLTMEVTLRAPREGGDYRLVWDVVQEQVIWFGAKTGQETVSAVRVMGDATDEPIDSAGVTGGGERFEAAWNHAAPIPGRLTLWRAAWQLWRSRPLLGVGLDNFRLLYGRLLYGRPLAYEMWNTSIHTNNWYVETMVSLGFLGGVPFLLLLALVGADMVVVLRRPVVTVWQAAVAAGLLAYLLHGLLDYFLLFNATGLLFWLLLGLWLALRPLADGGKARE